MFNNARNTIHHGSIAQRTKLAYRVAGAVAGTAAAGTAGLASMVYPSVRGYLKAKHEPSIRRGNLRRLLQKARAARRAKNTRRAYIAKTRSRGPTMRRVSRKKKGAKYGRHSKRTRYDVDVKTTALQGFLTDNNTGTAQFLGDIFWDSTNKLAPAGPSMAGTMGSVQFARMEIKFDFADTLAYSDYNGKYEWYKMKDVFVTFNRGPNPPYIQDYAKATAGNALDTPFGQPTLYYIPYTEDTDFPGTYQELQNWPGVQRWNMLQGKSKTFKLKGKIEYKRTLVGTAGDSIETFTKPAPWLRVQDMNNIAHHFGWFIVDKGYQPAAGNDYATWMQRIMVKETVITALKNATK